MISNWCDTRFAHCAAPARKSRTISPIGVLQVVGKPEFCRADEGVPQAFASANELAKWKADVLLAFGPELALQAAAAVRPPVPIVMGAMDLCKASLVRAETSPALSPMRWRHSNRFRPSRRLR
jgi:hypothetical protein